MADETSIARSSTWLQRLAANGYRLTAPRQAVVEIVAASPHILSPLEVYNLARNHHPRLGLVTVYRTMEKLEELGLLQRVHQPSGCQGFIAAVRGHQHMLICQQCGLVRYFDGRHDKIDTLMEDVAQSSGFRVADHWLQLFGLCEHCQ